MLLVQYILFKRIFWKSTEKVNCTHLLARGGGAEWRWVWVAYLDFLWLIQPYTGMLDLSSSLLLTVSGRRWSREGASALILRRAKAAFRWVLHSKMACSISNRSGSTVSPGRACLCWNLRPWKSHSITITRPLSSTNCKHLKRYHKFTDCIMRCKLSSGRWTEEQIKHQKCTCKPFYVMNNS